jgi:hypothetical protein
MVLALGLPSARSQDGSSLPYVPESKKQIVQFNGLGRTILNHTGIQGNALEMDTSTARQRVDGEFLLDLAINAQPGEDFEVQSILRLRNEFGGFFGAGVNVEIRELWARGIIANTIRYRVGDFDHVMTPYTFFLPDEEGMINQAEIFRPLKDVLYYEQFYTENNERRLQGAHVDFGLDFPVVLDAMKVTGFLARLRGTDFFTVPTRFTGGGRVDLNTQTLQKSLGIKGRLGFNLVHTWDDLNASGNANSGMRNNVWSVDFDWTLLSRDAYSIQLKGEAGRSSVRFLADTTATFDRGDSFLEAGLVLNLKKQDVRMHATFIDIGPDFFSTAAQSKRIDFDRNKTYFNRLGNDRRLRRPSLFDISRDRGLYTSQLSDRLMAYDPRYANVMPYGRASANRRGLLLGADYGSEAKFLEAGVEAAILREIRGQGTFELKSLQQVRATANLNWHHLLDWERRLSTSLGVQRERSNRGGEEVEQVNLQSTLIELGLEIELFSRFDFLLGAQLLNAQGSEYIPLIEQFNEVRDFPGRFLANDREQMMAGGIRYRFSDTAYLTVQAQQFGLQRIDSPEGDYQIRQFFALFNMAF